MALEIKSSPLGHISASGVAQLQKEQDIQVSLPPEQWHVCDQPCCLGRPCLSTGLSLCSNATLLSILVITLLSFPVLDSNCLPPCK